MAQDGVTLRQHASHRRRQAHRRPGDKLRRSPRAQPFRGARRGLAPSAIRGAARCVIRLRRDST